LRKDFESFAAQFFDSKIKSLALFAIYYNFMHVHKCLSEEFLNHMNHL